MSGSGVALLVAAVLLVVAFVKLVGERLLRRRLAPVEARLINAGDTEQIWETPMQAERRAENAGSALGGVPDRGYTARWVYEVAGQRYQAEHSQSSPVFRKEQIRFGRVQVYYDRAKPSVSRPFPGAGDQAWAWFVAAGAAVVVGFAIHVLTELPRR